MSEWFIGLMSGTSLDGVDGVLVRSTDGDIPLEVIGHASHTLPSDLKEAFLSLNAQGPNEIHRGALAANALVRIYADVVSELLTTHGLPARAVRAIGSHGQTVRHRPQAFDSIGYTIQLNQPALLAEWCGIDVVADFRSRDVAAGGQGAPLVPPFHRAFFGHPSQSRAILNVGGISNISLVPARHSSQAHEPLWGFDCGPGNALMDTWCSLHTGAAFDDGGRWGAQGRVNQALLACLQEDGFFDKAPPKSTGRDLFNAEWLNARLKGFEDLSAVDVQATLVELTAWACVQGMHSTALECDTLVVCGGGAFNLALMERLQAWAPKTTVCSSQALGIAPHLVEACAFAWLAQQAVHHKPASVPSVTGAKGERILGAIYLA
jgi:anhydro-N-acetylmuramic acid kinase